MATFTLVQSGRSADVEATIDESGIWIDASAIKDAIGWELRPEGLCRLDVCIPCPSIQISYRAVYLAPPRMHIDQVHRTRHAPDFQLPDLDGVHHSLSEHRGSKVLLIAWASW